MSLAERVHPPRDRVMLVELFEGETPGLRVAPTGQTVFLVAIIEMLRQLFDDLLLARRRQAQWSEPRPQLAGPFTSALLTSAQRIR